MAYGRFKRFGRRVWRRARGSFGSYKFQRQIGISRRRAAKAAFGGLLRPKYLMMAAALCLGLMVWLNWTGIKEAYRTRGLLGTGTGNA